MNCFFFSFIFNAVVLDAINLQRLQTNFASSSLVEQTAAVIPGGAGFIEFGEFRIGVWDQVHFSISIGNKVVIVFRSDGTQIYGPINPPNHGLGARKILSTGSDVIIGNGYLEFDKLWRLAVIDNNHLSISHKDGKTAMIWRSDGLRFPGPRMDYNYKKILSDVPMSLGDKFIAMGPWRLGSSQRGHFSITSTATNVTVVIYRHDGTLHPGPRKDFLLTGLPTRQFNAPEGEGYVAIPGGAGFIELGDFRLGVVHNQFSITSGDKTAMIFYTNGTYLTGPSSDYRLDGKVTMWDGSDVKAQRGYLEFAGAWRLGVIDNNHLSIAHKSGKTAMIWRSDGLQFPGPTTRWTTWERSVTDAPMSLGLNFIAIGLWRLGQSALHHFSISYVATNKTAVIYRDDGNVFVGPRHDFLLSGWPTRKLSCGKIRVNGYWKPMNSVIEGQTYEEAYGWEESKGRSMSSDWQVSFGVSVTAGFSASVGFAEASAEVSVSSEYSRSGGTAVEQSSTKSGEVTMGYESPGNGVLWQWMFTGGDHCGNLAKLKTKSLALTNSYNERPCCPVGLFKNASDPRGACQEKKLCTCNPGRCNFLHRNWNGCRDISSSEDCLDWKNSCSHSYVRNQCSKTCGVCKS